MFLRPDERPSFEQVHTQLQAIYKTVIIEDDDEEENNNNKSTSTFYAISGNLSGPTQVEYENV